MVNNGIGREKQAGTSLPAFEVSEKTSFSRKQSPTELKPKENEAIPQRSMYRRMQETLKAASEIHGGSQENRQPALNGMFCTLEKYASAECFKEYMSSSKKLLDASTAISKDDVTKFEGSRENITRSFSLLYAGGLLSKRKYAHIKSSLSTTCIGTKTTKGYLKRKRIQIGGGIPLPKVLSYKELISNVNDINVGELLSVRDTLCCDLPVEKKVDGVYRNLENLLVSLAEFYLTVDSYRKDEDRLTWFGGDKGEFKVAVGGDGAPFGKWDESVSWLISFLNVGPRVASPNDNFLLFGANCKETHEVVVKFSKLLSEQCAAIEKPLHLKNNAVQKLHNQMLKLALAKSNLPNNITSMAEMPQCSVKRYLESLDAEVKATRLKKQLIKWLLEDKTKDKDFTYRFTGKDSRLILHGFMYLINAIRGNSTDLKLITKLLVIVFTAVRLRDSVSLFSMYHFSEEKCQKLFSCTSDYLVALTLFGYSPSPSEWSIGRVAAVHAQWMFERYGTGLGINTMQGREAKHVHIASYARHSHIRNRWLMIFRHDYIRNIWLPLQQPSLLVYHRAKESLVPDRIEDSLLHCSSCGFLKSGSSDKCYYCGHEIMAEIVKSVASCKVTAKLSSILL